jgi:hypothetical protein
MSIARRHLLLPAALTGLGLPAAVANAMGAPRALNHRGGVMLRGFDTVAWFAEARPRRGTSAHQLRWAGATWHFATADHRDRFAATPEAFAPAFGGFCAFGVARGYKVDIDPAAWRIHDGRLYLNYDLGVQRQWQADIPGHIAAAEANWPRLMDS